LRAVPSGRLQTTEDLACFVAALRTHARLFVRDAAALDRLLADAQLVRGDREPVNRDLIMETEEHLRAARLAARDMCDEMGASRLVQQRVATVVSELGRNIISYTPGGTIRIFSKSRDRLGVIAEDRGRGITNLEEVLSGTYKSKTGLGRGLAGVKKLMDTFDIATGPKGTRIFAEAIVK
jgi:serine/threonine-protein kinase RsbT